jgi:predicted membrane GTPase involved in stress response
MQEFKDVGPNRIRMIFTAASRGLMAFRSALKSETHGSAVVCSTFDHYRCVARFTSPPFLPPSLPCFPLPAQ